MKYWHEMDNTLKVIEELRNTSSNKEKIAILSKNKDDVILQKTLNYTYDSFKKYGISEEVYDTIPLVEIDINGSPFAMFDELSKSNINDKLRERVKCYIENKIPEPYRELVKCILFKDLKLGVNAKTINKVWKGLVPLFEVQLAESYGKKEIPLGKEFAITTKLDGFRILAVPNDNGTFSFYTRKGELYEGIDHLQKDCQLLGGFVLDGELIARNDDNLSSGDLYKITSKIARKKGKTPDKARLEFHVFDILPKCEFVQGESKMTYSERRDLIESLFNAHDEQLNSLKKVELLYRGNDQNAIPTLMQKVTEHGYEGLMINLMDSKYLCKRHSGILKVKEFKEADVYVKDIYEGTGRNKGRLGGVVIQYLYNGELHECECGSGFTDKHRNDFWVNPSLIVDKVIEIQYFETTTNDKGGYGLRFPTFKNRIRADKDFEDISDVGLQ